MTVCEDLYEESDVNDGVIETSEEVLGRGIKVKKNNGFTMNV